MINILPKKKLKKPKYSEKPVSAKQYNELIEYYTLEIEKIKKELNKERTHNRVILNTNIRQETRTKTVEDEKIQLAKENRKLLEEIQELNLKNN